MSFLDIISLNAGTSSSKNPFSFINQSFVKSVSGKANCFLNNTDAFENPEDDQRMDHNLTVTLLPHQIIVFPTTIFKNMDSDVIERMRFYDNGEIR